MKKLKGDRFKRENDLFRRHGGILRASEAIRLGVSRRALYAMRDLGLIECLSRGVYRLSGAPQFSSPDLVTVAKRVPQGVICLISALAFHDLTTQIPHEIHLAVHRGKKRPPRIDYPPVRTFQLSGLAFSEGIETRRLDGTNVRIYSLEKSIADVFKFRGKVGLDVFLEALKVWRSRPRRNLKAVLFYAKINRVEKQIRPYLEANQ